MALLELLEHLRNSLLTDFNMGFTVIGEDLLILTIFCLIFWCIDKKLAYRICFISIISCIFINGLRVTFRLKPPYERNMDLNSIESAKKINSGYAFPCINIGFSSSLFLALSMFSKRRLLRILYIIPIIILSVSYLYLGIFSPYDVLAAFLITLIVAFITYCLIKYYSLEDIQRIWIIILFLILVSLLTYYCFDMYHNSTMNLSDFSDISKFIGFVFAFIPSWYIESRFIKFWEKGATFPIQIIKYVIGMDFVLTIKIVTNLILNLLNANVCIKGFSTYFAMTVFVIVLYPLVIKLVFTNKIQAYRRH